MNNPHNLLSDQTSPYLLQHADNPVNWFPWGAKALELAREQNKPILLSIGYSACHWCHVMAHESFEDEATAALMNEYCINIKVDREERPDLDKIYQLAHQMMTGRGGGWPLTLFLSPHDQTPFFAGTYFPSTRKHGMRSFSEILQAVNDAWLNKQTVIGQQSEQIKDNLEELNKPQDSRSLPDKKYFSVLNDQLISGFDKTHGGFTPTPKFPHPYSLERTLRQFYLYGDEFKDLFEAGIFTLQKMSQGGLFDHIGGGFCRYSTDEKWMIPHFEKMLYDNGQLLPLYAWAYQLYPDPYFKNTVTSSANWIIAEMQSEEGGYYSAQDADSEGEEGKFYVFTPAQIDEVLTPQQSEIFKQLYGFNLPANFEGKWYPHSFQTMQEYANSNNMKLPEVEQVLNQAKHKLYEYREQRIRPGTDDKILTSWNALMIRAMNISARTLGKPEYSQSASRALDFIHRELWKNKRLLASYRAGKAQLNAYLDDYAYLLSAIVDALQNGWNDEHYEWAKDIANTLLELFEDKQQGGFYFTSSDHEELLMRSKSYSDDAMPNGNSIAASALQTLGLLSGETRYLDSAEKTLLAASNEISKYPILYCSMLNNLDSYLNPPTLIILRGETEHMKAWQQSIFEKYRPDVWCFAIDQAQNLSGLLSEKKIIKGKTCAYICQGLSCQQPITDFAEFNKFLENSVPPSPDTLPGK